MVYREENRDLFSVSDDYMLAHCISSDFRLGAGIASHFSRLGVRDELRRKFKSHWDNKGYSIVVLMSRYPNYKWAACVNLVTKKSYWHKPTLKAIEEALINAKNIIPSYTQCRKIAMPLIGCGLDKQKWDDVSEIIKKVFADTDFEILVCKLK